MRIAFHTFGCRLNRAEALDMEARCAAVGHEIVRLSPEAAPDAIVIRGCSVTARAQRDCEKAVLRLARAYPRSRVAITGCFHLSGLAIPPEITNVRGLTDLEDLADIARPEDLEAFRNPVPSGTSRAYLKIQDGCSGKCAFCIVPTFRGAPRSEPFDAVLARARAFLAAGYREIVVTGCNLALYRSQGRGLADVLSALAELPRPGQTHNRRSVSRSGNPVRIRLGSLEPGICDATVLDAFAAHPNICRFIHLSLQSGSDAVLRRMNRPYTIDTVARFCADAAARLGPRLTLGADVITGFPGETEADFERTRSFLADSPVTLFHVFPYSERLGTPAATMDGSLPRAVRRARARTLEALGAAKRAAFARSFLGQPVEVCVERGGEHGWTAEYLPCHLARTAPRRALVTGAVARIEDGSLFLS